MNYVVEYLSGEYDLQNFDSDEEAVRYWIVSDERNQIPIVGIYNHDTKTELVKSESSND